MKARRLVVVLPLGPRGESGAFFSFSLLAHLLFLAFLVLTPTFRRQGPSLGDALVVELAGGIPGPPAGSVSEVRPPAPPPAAPTQAEERAVAVPDPAKKKRDKNRKDEKEKKKEPPKETAPSSGSGPASPQAAAPASGTGAAAAAPGGAGGITSLDGADVEFAWYRALVTSALKSRWVRPVLEGSEPVSATVAFEIRRDGSVQDVRVETPSGVSVMDRSVLRAVIESSPLPPLPPTWREPTLSARFEFRWRPGDAE